MVAKNPKFEGLHPRAREGEFATKLDVPSWLGKLGDQLVAVATGGKATARKATPSKRSAPAAPKAPAAKATKAAKTATKAAAPGFAEKLDAQALARSVSTLDDKAWAAKLREMDGPQRRRVLDSMTAADLKQRAKGAGLPVSGAKANLVERLDAHVQGKSPKAQQNARVQAATRERVQADIAETRRQQEIAARAPGTRKAGDGAASPEDLARSRQAEIDTKRATAEVAAEVHELVNNGADHVVLRRGIDAAAKRHGLPDADRERLLEAADEAHNVELENAIRAAYRDLGGRPGGNDWVAIADIRDRLGEQYNRHEVDDALRRLEREPGNNIVPQSNQKALTQADRDAAVRIGGQDKHFITIDRAEPRPDPLIVAADDLAAKAGLTRLGTAGETVSYAAASHQAMPGTKLRAGQKVEVVRPGYTARLASGEDVRLSKALVEPAVAKAAPAKSPPPPPPAALRQQLVAAQSVDERLALLRALNLNQAQARRLARDLGVKGQDRSTAEQILPRIAEHFVGEHGLDQRSAERDAAIERATARQRRVDTARAAGRIAAEIVELETRVRDNGWSPTMVGQTLGERLTEAAARERAELNVDHAEVPAGLDEAEAAAKSGDVDRIRAAVANLARANGITLDGRPLDSVTLDRTHHQPVGAATDGEQVAVMRPGVVFTDPQTRERIQLEKAVVAKVDPAKLAEARKRRASLASSKRAPAEKATPAVGDLVPGGMPRKAGDLVAVWRVPGAAPAEGSVAAFDSRGRPKVVDWDGGRREKLRLPDPGVRFARVGSQSHRWLLDPDSLHEAWRDDPRGVVLALQDELDNSLGRNPTLTDVRRRLDELGIETTVADLRKAVSGPAARSTKAATAVASPIPAAPPEVVAQHRTDLHARLANLGRRVPADGTSLDLAARALAAGAAPAAVAKALRADAKDVANREDAETLRLLAADLTRKVPVVPAYINDRGNIDLVKLAEEAGVDIRRWMPAEDDPHGAKYHEEHPWDRRFRYAADKLADPEPTFPRAKVVQHMRDMAARIRQSVKEVKAGQHPAAQNPARAKEAARYIDTGPDAARDLERLADAVEKAKVAPKKRSVTLGGTTLGEVVPVDEAQFREVPIKGSGAALRHRGEAVPVEFQHDRFGGAMAARAGQQARPGLTEPENRALDLYTVAAVADGLNGSLRRGRNVHGETEVPGAGTVDLDQVRRDMDDAIAASTLDRDAVLWRGSVVKSTDLQRLVPGAIYTDLGYLSTAATEAGARHVIDWRKGKLPAGRKQVLFKILAPAGTHGALGHEAADEVVLPRGQQLRVVRLDDSGPTPVVVMEVIQTPQDEAGVARGRHLVDELDYEAVAAGDHGSFTHGNRGDLWLGRILREQGFDGRPRLGSTTDLDQAIADGGIELFRGVTGDRITGETASTRAEQFRSGDLYPGVGRFGNGTYASPDRAVAAGYANGDDAGMLRMVLRRDARTISITDLLKLRAKSGATRAGRDLNEREEVELSKLDPTDVDAAIAVRRKYDELRKGLGPRGRVASDLGRLAALLGYDAVVVPTSYRGHGGSNGVDEYVILNRTALTVQEAGK